MQASLRLQQEYAGLVARGDELIVQLSGSSDEPPAWATFDEEAVAEPLADPMGAEPVLPIDAPGMDPMTLPGPPGAAPVPRRSAVVPLLSAGIGEPSAFDLVEDADAVGDEATDLRTAGWISDEDSDRPSDTAKVLSEGEPLVSTGDLIEAVGAPVETAPVPGYDGWTVAQLRARLRRLSTGQLDELLAYEHAGRQRVPYVTMLTNRLAAVSRS